MTLLLIILVLLVGLIFVFKSITRKESQPRQEFQPRQDPQPAATPVFTLDKYDEIQERKASILQREDDVFVLNSGLSSQITLIGASARNAAAIRSLCEKFNSSSTYDAEKAIRDILMENAIQVGEVIAFQNEVRPIIERRVQRLISADTEWESLGEMDREDKRAEYIDQSMVAFPDDITPMLEGALTNLAMNTPIQVPLLNEMIAEYGVSNINTYCEYNNRKNPIISISNPNYRKPLEELVKVGLASTGKDMSVEELLSSLTLNELNEISGAESRFTRKDKAIQFIAEKDDVLSIIEKNIALRSLFVLRPLPELFQGFDFEKYNKLLEYYEALADVVVSVYNGYSTIAFKDK